MARNSSFAENSTDCLKVLNILSLQSIRKFKPTEKVEKGKDENESNLIKSFFQNGNASNLVDVKWNTSSFE